MTHTFATVAIPFVNDDPADTTRGSPAEEVQRLLKDLGQKVFEERDQERCRRDSKQRAGCAAANLPLQDTICGRLDDTGIIHFMSVHVVRGTPPGKAHLLIEVSADGSIHEALRAVAQALGEQLTAILRLVDPANRLWSESDALARLMISHHYPISQGWSAPILGPALGFVFDGSPGMDVRRIKMEQRLAARISGMDILSCPDRTPLEKLEAVREALWWKKRWAFVPEPTPMLDRPKPSNPADAPPLGSQQVLGQPGMSGDPGLPSGPQLLVFILPAFRTLLWPLLVPMAILFGGLEWALGATDRFGGAILSLAATILLSTLAVGLVAWLAKRYLNELESTDPARDNPPCPNEIGQQMQSEGRCAQGLLAAVSTMKTGKRVTTLFRRLALRFVFWFISEATSRLAKPGYLGPISDIHFARWFLLPGSDQLFFWSNYDGAWESYIEDFIQLGHEGVSAIWSNTVDFPRTRDLFQDGASDGDRLRHWARRQMQHMCPPQFWYSAYPDLTLDRIRYNAAIRQGIASASTNDEAKEWLSLFGSAPAPRTAPRSPPTQSPLPPAIPPPLQTLEKAEIPTLLFGGRRRMLHGVCLVITMTGDAKQCREWLKAIEHHITYGDDHPPDYALAFAISSTGLDKLELDEADLNTFPAAFRNGMTAVWRSRALGDAGQNDPSKWEWANKIQGAARPADPDRPRQADAVLLVYATTENLLQIQKKIFIDSAEQTGQTIAQKIPMRTLPPPNKPLVDPRTREPFGFVDGISQPLLRGTRRASAAANDAYHVVEPGELILGYLDNSGYYSATPTIGAKHDPDRLLADATEDMPTRRPGLCEGAFDGRRDLGRNGTFLVVRQLEQDVNKFNRWLDEATDAAPFGANLNRGHRREMIAAKLIGRWRLNGISLLRQPERPGYRNAPADNDFLLGQADPQGLRCPFGSHIRRANPRDSLDTDNPVSALDIANRHRILRVSRPYNSSEEPEADDPRTPARGTLFMCLNADIERQFEFIQQTYLLGRNFQSLQDEVDPLIGGRSDDAPGPAGFTVPTVHGPARLPSLADFVTVRGGGYFFMPARRTVRFLAGP